MFQKILLPLVIPLSLMASIAQANSFVYRAYYPTTRSCHNESATTIASFKSQTQAEILNAKCITTTVGDLDQTKTSVLFIEYSAKFENFPANFVVGGNADAPNSTAFGNSYSDGYSTLQACETEISKQVATLKKLTALTPVTAYCQAIGDTLPGFAMHIDSFQKTTSAIFVVNAFSGTPEASDLAKASQLVNYFGGAVTHIYKNKIYFYDQVSPLNSSAHANLKSEVALVSGKDSDCDSQRNVVAASLAKYGSKSLVSCTKADPAAALVKGYSGSAVEVLGADLDQWTFNQASSVGYHTISECRQDQSRVINNAQVASKSVVAGTCGFTGDGPRGDYDVILIYHRSNGGL